MSGTFEKGAKEDPSMDEKGHQSKPCLDATNTVEELTIYTQEEERAVLRKIDRVVLPLMCIVNFFQYLDKQSIGFAAVFNMPDELGMSSKQYSWSVSSFYFGQLISEYVFIYIMSRLPISRTVGWTVITWGVVAGCLAAPGNFSGFTAVRFLLGFTEGGVSPAFVIITGSWYKKSEQPFRVAGWVTCNGLAQIFGALIMYGIGLAGNTAISNWRVMFLVCGGGTVLSGILFLVFMPLGPGTAWFLNARERSIATQRLAEERISKEQTTFKVSQLKEALLDHRVWLLVIGAFCNTLASPVIKFGTLVINGFGWSKLNTMLVSLPAGVLQIIMIWIVVVGIRVTKIPRSCWGILASIPPLVGNICLLVLPMDAKWGIVGCTWMATVLSPTMVVFLSLIASNFKGNTKKSVASNSYFILYAAAAIAGPQLWTNAPRYVEGVITDIVAIGACIVVFALFGLSVGWENKRRDKNGHRTAEEQDSGDADVTDKQDKDFRYTW
ncbi:unnamed protein product [Clonostachys byssicola]|uniref:Major facilitator superfamily (MFS) profile domain-containing protein n=1 Tax=Clonostachys byssicola TaxID=160290 RepID=A0A9N9URF9_9HYPO|nr:unnamed protein product [Clonostachys byssicola]